MTCRNCLYTFTQQIPISGNLICGSCQNTFTIPSKTLADGIGINTNSNHIFQFTTPVTCPHCDQIMNFTSIPCEDKGPSLLDLQLSYLFESPPIITT